MAQPSFISAALNAQLEKRKDDAKAKLSSELNKLVDDLFGIFTGEFNRQVQEAISAVNEVAFANINDVGKASTESSNGQTTCEHQSASNLFRGMITNQTETATNCIAPFVSGASSSDLANELIKQENPDSDDDSILFIGETEPQRKKRRKSRKCSQQLLAEPFQAPRGVIYQAQRDMISQESSAITQMNFPNAEEFTELSTLDDDCKCSDCLVLGTPKEEPTGEEGNLPTTVPLDQFEHPQATGSTLASSSTASDTPFRYETISLKCAVPGCTQLLANRLTKNDHLALVHQLPTRFCYLAGCGMWLPKTLKAADHLNQYHGNLERFPCLGCSHSAISYRQLSQHYCRHHIEGQYLCRATEDCTFTAAVRSEMVSHQVTVHYKQKSLLPNSNT